VHRLHTAGVALDLIGVEHDDDAALTKALIVGENVDQRAARRGGPLRAAAAAAGATRAREQPSPPPSL